MKESVRAVWPIRWLAMWLATMCLLLLFCWLSTDWILGLNTVEDKERTASDTAKTLGLKSPVIYCDPSSTLLCGCLVSHGPADNRRVESWYCCGGGCS